MIVSYLPAERLDDLIAATGFDLESYPYEHKYRWLLERIGMLRERSDAANIVHDNPEISQLVALIQYERRWSAGLTNTIAGLQAELERLRNRVV